MWMRFRQKNKIRESELPANLLKIAQRFNAGKIAPQKTSVPFKGRKNRGEVLGVADQMTFLSSLTGLNILF
jgi:hypothetical protein